MAGMYVYYRQCHKALKPAAVFPIEVELGIDFNSQYLPEAHHFNSGSHDGSSTSHDQGEDEPPASEETKAEENLLDLLLPDVPAPVPSLPAAAEEDSRSEVDKILAQLQEPEL